ncbi:MAG: glycosyltransferase family 2 protein [Paraprevotella sp.]|nr:glycosyltransferase family 2 protein [Paraprevotella sp.]
MKLSVVIVSYNVKYYLEQCLFSLRKAGRSLDSEIWVVDNASHDGTVEYLRSRFPEVHWMENEENVGFARANNMAIRQASGEYVLLLNPDTFVGEHTVTGCLDFLDAHPEAGATGVAMLKDDGGFAWESRRGLPTPFTSFCKMSGLGTVFPYSRRFGRYYMRYLATDEVHEIEVISGAFNMLRHTALDKIGLLDEDFFMYGEDIDLSYRLLRGGYKNYYQPLQILHYKGESTHKSSFRYVHVFYKAMLIFFDKHYRRHNRWLTPFICGAVVMRGLIDLFIRQKDRLIHLLRGRTDREVGRTYLFLGRPEAIEMVCKLAVEHDLRMDFVAADATGMPDGHHDPSLSARQYDYVVYDVGAYRYEQILNLISRKVKGRRPRLGTYSTDTQKLITLTRVY